MWRMGVGLLEPPGEPEAFWPRSVIHGFAASASAENLLELSILRELPRLLNQKLWKQGPEI